MKLWCSVLVSAIVLVSFAAAAPFDDIAAHRVVIVDASTHKLECLDWPGAGRPIVMLAGLGSTGHIFDGLAARLSQKHRVVALTRRGIGASEAPSGEFDQVALLEDIRVALDHFSLGQVVLVAHSFGCTEASLFAQAYPERVSAVIYLDGAYRPSASRWQLLGSVGPLMPSPSPGDAASLTSLLAWMEKFRPGWNPACESDLRSQLVVEGETFRPRADPGLMGMMMRIAQSTEPRYEAVRCPSFAIFADNRVLGMSAALPDERVSEKTALRAFASFVDNANAEFDRTVALGKSTLLADTDHFCFIHREALVTELILEFIAE